MKFLYPIALSLIVFYTANLLAKNISTGTININTASHYQLTLLPGIGNKTATKIIQFRQTNGPFQQKQQLLNQKLVLKRYYAKLQPFIRLQGPHQYDDPNTSKKKKASSSYSSKDYTINIDKNYPIRNIQLLTDRSYFKSLKQDITKAKKSIWVSTFVFKTTSKKGNNARQLTNLLIKKAQENINVNVLLEKSNYHTELSKENKRIAKRLEKYNINTYFDSENNTMHSKIIIIDDKISYIGSHNLTHSALSRNHEVSVRIEDKNMALELINYMKTIANEKN